MRHRRLGVREAEGQGKADGADPVGPNPLLTTAPRQASHHEIRESAQVILGGGQGLEP